MLALLCCIYQFSFDHLGPFALAAVLLSTVAHYRPALRWLCWIVAGFSVTTFLLDAAIFRHRLTMEWRCWSPVWDDSDIAVILPSPSRRSTAYIVEGGFLDSAYWAYISDGGLFPKHCHIDTGHVDAYYPRDFSADWSGSVFSVVRVRYDEASRQLSTSNP